MLTDSGKPQADGFDPRVSRQLHMALLTILSPKKGVFESLQECVDALWAHPLVLAEWAQALEALDARIVHLQQPLSVLDAVPLQVHAHYARDEVLAAFGISTLMAPHPLQAGVYWHAETKTDLLFVTLQKTEKEFSPATRYKDYAISEQLFHWERASLQRRRSVRPGSAISANVNEGRACSCSCARARPMGRGVRCPTSAPDSPTTSVMHRIGRSRSHGS